MFYKEEINYTYSEPLAGILNEFKSSILKFYYYVSRIKWLLIYYYYLSSAVN